MKIEKLDRLKKAGSISDAEFARLRARLVQQHATKLPLSPELQAQIAAAPVTRLAPGKSTSRRLLACSAVSAAIPPLPIPARADGTILQRSRLAPLFLVSVGFPRQRSRQQGNPVIELACFLLIVFVLFGRAAAQSVFAAIVVVFVVGFLLAMTVPH